MKTTQLIPSILLSLVPTLTLADSVPSGAKLCVGQGAGSCQFAAYQLQPTDTCEDLQKNAAYIYDHECNLIGHTENFAEGDAIDSQLPYTVDIKNIVGGPSCAIKYEIAYSDGLYGYGMPSGGVWGSCSESGHQCNWYRVAFDCPGF
ncbi:hypothetical protein AtubIFM56815_004719 [Aspergillus tubingensis]|uniref:Uncharacterized protein n=2 Tax=Aspergillus subgen. Circumdati TaxID=2720871 RepID=A0A9W6EHC3_ASPTU|nr:similar to An11g09010 [Aspergillus niger]GLA57998.1 hypothetical protein AtubIFM54640_005802 [Aspergillus tubingensis]GLA81086.1 hypothetical protein AtubIFM56815_004719 [Aspergillus tubingensis]GLA91613.1 hypothetical protein AtubIFM57143_005116 [Aspergillus tubingensis]GLB17807.1 hypothetical protein AtubIFM61612_007696 [Aspergillus tubingensis]